MHASRQTVQEYFVDDLCELMLYVGQTCPKSLEGLQLEEIMTFMVVFMGSPGYVKNPFLRSRISEVTPVSPVSLRWHPFCLHQLRHSELPRLLQSWGGSAHFHHA